MKSMREAYLGAGSNIDPEKHLQLACDGLAREFGALSLSSVYRSSAVGFEGPDFLNMVIAFSTDADWRDVNAALVRIEQMAGRDRDSRGFASRTLDLDLLLYGDLVIDDPSLKLPRADIAKYAFVLQPLAELAPDLKHPVSGLTMREMWESFDAGDQSLVRLAVSHQPMLRPPSTEIT